MKTMWELMEMEAPDKFYVDSATSPAFLLFPKGHLLSLLKNGYNLYLNNVGLISAWKTRKRALERLRAIVENANFPVNVYHVKKTHSKREQRVLFAKNTVTRVDRSTLTALVKTFEIDEWSNLDDIGKIPYIRE